MDARCQEYLHRLRGFALVATPKSKYAAFAGESRDFTAGELIARRCDGGG